MDKFRIQFRIEVLADQSQINNKQMNCVKICLANQSALKMKLNQVKNYEQMSQKIAILLNTNIQNLKSKKNTKFNISFTNKELVLTKSNYQLYKASLNFWSRFQPYNSENETGCFVILNDTQYFSFGIQTLQQLNSLKKKFIKFSIIKSFYQDYKPIRKIGQGKSASVFLARNRSSGQKVAVKAFCKQFLKNNVKSIMALQNQVQILRSIENKFLIQFQGFYETEKSFYIVTKYVEGQTLRDLLQNQQLNYKQRINISKSIFQGLDHLSNKNIAHRDIKPENIIVKRNGHAVIIDFGLSTFCNQQQSHLFQKCGTPGFVAPQILQKSFITTPKVDIFSFGIVFYLMVFKKFPYNARCLQQLIKENAQVKFDFKNIQSLISPTQRYIFQNMLLKNPLQRLAAFQLLQFLNCYEN